MLDIGNFLIILPYLWRALAATIIVLLGGYTIWKNWVEAKFLWMRFWFWIPLPVLNRSRRLSRNLALVEDCGRLWFLSERTLCAAFRAHLNAIVFSPKDYDNAQNYLCKVHEGDRKPMGVGGWILISVLVFIEATGFALVLAGFVVPGVPDSWRPIVAVMLAVLLSIILVLSTHAAGREAHWRSLMKRARAMWNDDDKTTRKKLASKNAQLTIANDSTDNNAEPYQQILNRIDTHGKTTAGVPWINLATVALVIGVAIGAFWVRVEALEQQNVCATFGATNAPSYFSGPSGQIQVPSIVTAQQTQNASAGVNQGCAAMWRGSLIAYVILGFAFVAVQAIGWSMGNRFGFTGSYSYEAWKKWTRFGTKDEYIAWHQNREDQIKNIAQSNLSYLQELLAVRVEDIGNLPEQKDAVADSGKRTFEQYLLNRKPGTNIPSVPEPEADPHGVAA